MQILSPAKINIGLHITSKRPDGYHNLETIKPRYTDICVGHVQ
jgi:4-diphosphocytidyl-2C-methyl-D-erythritol kinase